MLELTTQGDLFAANAAAGFDEGYVAADVGTGIRSSFGASAEFCHGVDLAVNVDAAASALADLKLLWFLVGKAEGTALAGAGAEAKVKLDINLFETAGISAAAKAYAEASIAGRLSLSASFEDLAKLLRDRLNNLEYDIIIALLNEVSAGGGVWGKLSAAAMAKAEIEIICSLKDDANSGCIINADAEAGLGAGGGYGFYLGMKFDQPKRFFLYAAERVTRELVATAKSVIPANLLPALDYLELLLPVSLDTAYEIGQHNAKVFDDPDVCLKLFVDCFTAQAQRYALDKLVDFGLQGLNTFLQDSLDQIAGAQLDRAEREHVVRVLNSVIDLLRQQELHSTNLSQFIDPVSEALDALLPESKPKWEVALSVVWFALASVEAIRYGFDIASASASASFLGLTTPPASGQVLSLTEPPAVVVDTFRRALGYTPSRFTFGDALEYLIVHSGAVDRLTQTLPQIKPVLDAFSSYTGITGSDVLRFVLSASFGANLTSTDLYTKLRDLAIDGIDNYVLSELIPRIRRDARHKQDLLLYIDKVVEPAFLLTRNFVFSRLDSIAAGDPWTTDPVFAKTFSTALSSLLFKLVTANVLFVFEILYDHALDSLGQGLEQLGQRIQNASTDLLLEVIMQHLIEPLLPPLVDRSQVEPAGKRLVVNLCHAAAIGLGPAVISQQRRAELFDAIRKSLYSIDKTDDILRYRGAIEDPIEEFCQCACIPNPAGMQQLFHWQVQTLSRYLSTAAPLMADALAIFMIDVTAQKVMELEDAARQFVIGILEAVRALWEEYQQLVTALNQAIALAEQTVIAAAAALEAASQILKARAIRDRILNDIQTAGAKEARRMARHVPGFGLLSTSDREAALNAAEAVFNTAFDIARPLLSDCLEVLGDLDSTLADVLSTAGSFRAVVQGIIDGITQDITDIVGSSPIPLPGEIDVSGIIDAIESNLRNYSPISDALRAALRAAQDDQAAQEAKARAAERKDAAYQAHREKLEEQNEIVGTNVNIHIESPVPFFNSASGKNVDWMYGRDLPVWIAIEGATLRFVSPSSPQRVFVAVNGNEVRIPYTGWGYDGKALLLRTILSPQHVQFKSGVNIIECSVTSGAEAEPKRTKVAFCMCPDLAAPPGISVNEKVSIFNAPSNDHITVKQECVALKNNSSSAISLQGWRMLDLKNHLYQFPDISVGPRKVISVHTGAGRNRNGKYYWGRKRAVWNNTGDFVFLINPNGVLSYCYLYLPPGKRA
jgi:hypothetical protein